MVSLVVFAFAVIFILLVGKMPNTFLGLNKYNWAIVVLALFVAYNIVESMFQLWYIYFNDEKDKIVLRYFSLGYFNRMKRSIEIPKNELLSYQVYEYYYGYKKTIVLHQVRGGKEAKYPPVSLSILKKEELKQLFGALDSYKKY